MTETVMGKYKITLSRLLMVKSNSVDTVLTHAIFENHNIFGEKMSEVKFVLSNESIVKAYRIDNVDKEVELHFNLSHDWLLKVG